MRSWRKISATKSSVQYSRGYFRTQKITKIICISSQQHAIWKKVPLEQNLSNSERGKWTGRKTRGKSREGRTNVNDRCQRSRKIRFVSSFEILTFCYQFEISMKLVKELGKRIELAKKTWMTKTILPIEIINFFVRKTLPRWEREKGAQKTFRRDRFRTLTIVESPSKWLSLIFTTIEDPWLCTDWYREIKRCKKRVSTVISWRMPAWTESTHRFAKLAKQYIRVFPRFGTALTKHTENHRSRKIVKLTRLSKRKSTSVINRNKLVY